jgi:VIT1/CCC1 family predicted Fe2+/Mn2+ transporter
MTFGAYTSTKTEIESYKNQKNNTKTDKAGKKLSQEEKKNFSDFLATHPKIKEKINNNSGASELEFVDPVSKGLIMGISFICGGIIPLAPYLFPIPIWSFILASIFSFLSLFIIGILRSIITESKRSWVKFSLEMIGLGIIAVIIIEIYLYFITMSYGLLIWA